MFYILYDSKFHEVLLNQFLNYLWEVTFNLLCTILPGQNERFINVLQYSPIFRMNMLTIPEYNF